MKEQDLNDVLNAQNELFERLTAIQNDHAEVRERAGIMKAMVESAKLPQRLERSVDGTDLVAHFLPLLKAILDSMSKEDMIKLLTGYELDQFTTGLQRMMRLQQLTESMPPELSAIMEKMSAELGNQKED